MKTMRRHTAAALATALALASGSHSAHADPVTTHFSGVVDGYRFGYLDANAVAFDNDHPIGTTVQFDVTFDDSFLSLPWRQYAGAGPQDVSGTLRVGTDTYDFTTMELNSLTFDTVSDTALEYQMRVSATGPASSDGAALFGLFHTFRPDLSPAAAPSFAYGYADEITTTYGFVTTAGEYSITRGGQLPEPATALLVLPALFLLRRHTRR